MSSKFVGNYVKTVEEAVAAAALSGINAYLIGAPGYGKTTIASEALRVIYGDAALFIRFDTSTPPERVLGPFDMEAALGRGGRKQELIRITDNTPYDPRKKALLADEVARASDGVFELFLDVLDRRDIPPDDKAVVIATANFAPAQSRSQAVVDRFGLFVWVEPGSVDTAAIVDTSLDTLGGYPETVSTLPSADQIDEVRKWRPGSEAKKTVTDFLEQVESDARAANFNVNPRRLTQWAALVYRLNSYKVGAAEWNTLHSDAQRIVRFAWPATTKEVASRWQEAVAGSADAVGAAIETLMDKARDSIQSVISGEKIAGIDNLMALGNIIAEVKKELATLSAPPERMQEATTKLEQVLVRVARGEKPFDD